MEEKKTALDQVLLLPPKPSEPLEKECCGTGCIPCVFDIYKKQLKKWEEDCRRIKNGESLYCDINQNEENNPSPYTLTPEAWRKFKVVSIVVDCAASTSYIYKFSTINDDVTDLVTATTRPLVGIGQHVVVKTEDDQEGKQYTVLSIGEDYCFDMVIKIYPKGVLTPLLHKLNVGDSVLMRGPFGKVFSLKTNEYKNLCILACGTGVAPMYRVIESILANEDEITKIKLIFLNSSPKSILLKSKILEWSAYWNFQVVHYFSKCTKDEAKNGYYGITAHAKRFSFSDFQKECCQHGDDAGSCLYLVCGTKSFEKDILNYLTKSGIPKEHYHVF